MAISVGWRNSDPKPYNPKCHFTIKIKSFSSKIIKKLKTVNWQIINKTQNCQLTENPINQNQSKRRARSKLFKASKKSFRTVGDGKPLFRTESDAKSSHIGPKVRNCLIKLSARADMRTFVSLSSRGRKPECSASLSLGRLRSIFSVLRTRALWMIMTPL